MNTTHEDDPEFEAADLTSPGHLHSSAKENLAVLADFYEREEAEISGMQLVIERISAFLGSPFEVFLQKPVHPDRLLRTVEDL